MVDQESISTVPLFAGLDKQGLAALAQIVQLITRKKGDFLFEETAPEPPLYIIKQGAVRLTERVKGSKRQTLAILHAPEFLGELSLLDGKPTLFSAEVIKDAQLWVIKRADFEQFLKTYPGAGYLILKGLSKKICATLRHIDEEFIYMIKFVWELGAKI